MRVSCSGQGSLAEPPVPVLGARPSPPWDPTAQPTVPAGSCRGEETGKAERKKGRKMERMKINRRGETRSKKGGRGRKAARNGRKWGLAGLRELEKSSCQCYAAGSPNWYF